MTTLAIFDLDNTLLAGDSDYLWGKFLGERGLVDAQAYEAENLRYYQDYTRGALDILEFLSFSLRPLTQFSLDELTELHKEFMANKILPIITPASRKLLAQHRANGHFLLIITATNQFITAPIAEALGVDDLIATQAEVHSERYTGRVVGEPSFREGKIIRLKQWLDKHHYNLADSWFYSDSHNDLPLLEWVSHPVAVDPDETLANHARIKQWPIITLRGSEPEPLP